MIRKKWGQFASAGILAVVLPFMNPAQAEAAETLSIWYGPFQRSISIADLRQYAETQKAPPGLAAYLKWFKPAQRQGFQQLLNAKLPVDVTTVSRLVYSPQFGEPLLSRISPVIIRADSAGPQALRAALVLAAASKDGLGVISLLEAYPSSEINLDIPVLLRLLKSKEGFMDVFRGSLKSQQ
jgi:Alpha/beta hydrolase of unknown function (DUF1400)